MKRKSISQLIVLFGLSMAMVLLVGCAGGFGESETIPVSSSVVETSMQYVEGPNLGPGYDVTLNVPDDWVDKFEIRNISNRIYFDYLGDGGAQPAQIFFIDALSPSQYWGQSGSFPGSYGSIVNKGDTIFVYYLPVDSYYSSLPEKEFIAFSESVPGIVESFFAETQ